MRAMFTIYIEFTSKTKIRTLSPLVSVQKPILVQVQVNLSRKPMYVRKCFSDHVR
jgi:hypothetical protein